MKYVDSQLLVLLFALVSSILVHGYILKVINESVIVPVIKDKNRRVNISLLLFCCKEQVTHSLFQ